MRELIVKNKLIVAGVVLVILAGVFSYVYNLPRTEEDKLRQQVKSQTSKYPKEFQKALGDSIAGKVLLTTKDFYIQYYPTAQAFTVIVADANKITVIKKNVEIYFQSFGFKNLSDLKISYCNDNPANIDKQLSRWECST